MAEIKKNTIVVMPHTTNLLWFIVSHSNKVFSCESLANLH